MSADNEGSTDFSKASTVAVEDVFASNSSETREKTADITKSCDVKIRKPFLGGYRNKLTGVTYHNAATQTIKPPWNYGVNKQFSRDSQTVETLDESQQTSCDASTQVQVHNIFIQTTKDKVCESSETYISVDEIQAEHLAKVICAQKYVRRWLAEKELKRRQQDLLDKVLWEEEQKKIREKQDADFLRDLQKRKLYPVKEDDFLLLFSDLQNWWENEAKIIFETKAEPEQQDALCGLVKEEAEKISDINKIKIDVENRKLFHHRLKKLSEAGQPILWKAYKKEISVITESTQRAKNLQDLYVTLSMKYITTQDRIDSLHSLMQLLQHHNNNLTNMLCQLAQRETDLLLRGTKAKNLIGLRSRIQDLFWQYVKQPIFNPKMDSSLNLKKIEGKNPFILRCAGCKQFFALPSDTVNEETERSVMGNCFVKCKRCLYLENEGWIRKDVELYKKIMKLLIMEEEKKTVVSSIIYILQPGDIKHLVEAVWKRQSCLSGATDETELELVRYNVEDCWTPWNCLLVTREEAAILSGIPNPKESYDDQFKKFVYQRHIAARSYFARIPRFLPYIAKSTINKDYESSSEDESI